MDEARVREIGENIGVVIARILWAIGWVAVIWAAPLVAGFVGHVAWFALLKGWSLVR